MIGVERWQYQVKAEPLEPITPDFGWFVQASEPVRQVPFSQPEQSVLGEPPAIPSFDWGVAPPDVVRPLHQTQLGLFVLGNAELLPILWASETTAVLGEDQFQYQGKAEPVLAQVPIPDFGWFVQESDTIRPLHLVDEGVYVFGAEPIIPSFDWWVAPADVIRPPDRLVPEQLVLGAVPIIPAFDWFHQQADVVRPLHPVRPGLWVSGREEEVIEVDLDWFVVEPDPVLPLHQTRQGFFVLGRPPIIPAFDWWQQETDVIRLPKRLVPEAFALVEFRVPTPLDFDWWVQEPDVFHPAHLVRPGLFVTGTLPLIPSFGWWAQEPDVFKAPPHPEGFIARLDPVIPPEVLLQWFQIQENPILPFVWLLGEETRPLLVLVTPPGEVVFVIRDCIALSALEQNSVLPLPSSFVRGEDIVTPSTFVEDEDAVTPSTWTQEGKSTLWDDLSS